FHADPEEFLADQVEEFVRARLNDAIEFAAAGLAGFPALRRRQLDETVHRSGQRGRTAEDFLHERSIVEADLEEVGDITREVVAANRDSGCQLEGITVVDDKFG